MKNKEINKQKKKKDLDINIIQSKKGSKTQTKIIKKRIKQNRTEQNQTWRKNRGT